MGRVIDYLNYWLTRYERKCQVRQMNKDAWREIDLLTRQK